MEPDNKRGGTDPNPDMVHGGTDPPPPVDTALVGAGAALIVAGVLVLVSATNGKK